MDRPYATKFSKYFAPERSGVVACLFFAVGFAAKARQVAISASRLTLVYVRGAMNCFPGNLPQRELGQEA